MIFSVYWNFVHLALTASTIPHW